MNYNAEVNSLLSSYRVQPWTYDGHTYLTQPFAHYYVEINDEKLAESVYNLLKNSEFTETTFDTDNEYAFFLYYIGVYWMMNNMPDDAVKEWLKAAEFKQPNAIYKLANYYDDVHQEAKAIPYYIMSAELNNIDAMERLFNYYQSVNDYDNILKYYIMTVNKLTDEDMIKDCTTNVIHHFEKDNKLKELFNLTFSFNKDFLKHTKFDVHIKDWFNLGGIFSDILFDGYKQLNIDLQAAQSIIADNKATIAKQQEYIDELEALPDGPVYLAAKKHYETTVS
ncbi:MAG: hypothetical protein Faunusvirus2_45 [Faunusvirus sp.]|uniref:Sel1 repeat family protein n=1 Tax=Faunusvirus sp. TaxID=2487766 RepID=A0A3G4ZW21_9VIRU|nr:MAG: hypothetical protein Faunusvirus2_45 [Faunusvirus sp.]